MPDDFEFERRLLRPELRGALAAAFASVQLELLLRMYPGLQGPRLDNVEAALFAQKHGLAIMTLIKAEIYECRVLTAALIDVAEELTEGALPYDFFPRLVRLEAKLRRKKGHRATRNPERDDWVRLQYLTYRLYDKLPQEKAIEAIADEMCLSPKSVDRIVYKDNIFDIVHHSQRLDMARLAEYVRTHYAAPPVGAHLKIATKQ
jgi:hypothetical protein